MLSEGGWRTSISILIPNCLSPIPVVGSFNPVYLAYMSPNRRVASVISLGVLTTIIVWQASSWFALANVATCPDSSYGTDEALRGVLFLLLASIPAITILRLTTPKTVSRETCSVACGIAAVFATMFETAVLTYRAEDYLAYTLAAMGIVVCFLFALQAASVSKILSGLLFGPVLVAFCMALGAALSLWIIAPVYQHSFQTRLCAYGYQWIRGPSCLHIFCQPQKKKKK